MNEPTDGGAPRPRYQSRRSRTPAGRGRFGATVVLAWLAVHGAVLAGFVAAIVGSPFLLGAHYALFLGAMFGGG